ncbi:MULTISPECIES: fimbrial protein [Atlantibacter]|uniref:fimbrial protein n=1 Tax=Atlantibacter TaxID=1903434 RepID=UPI001931A13D|nr:MULTISPECIES: fimbrial protein [Atlantibacter]MBL7637097.1 fimbrial protein [Atlantibacter hermannii]MBL7674051.1 fimbrial protein [Atlantibacter hermannii]
MKKAYFRLLLLPLIMAAGIGQAAAENNSADLVISGKIKPDTFMCHVVLSETSISLLEKTDTLIKQGEDATAPTIIHISVDNGDPRCTALVDEGKIAYKVLGNADSINPYALANALSDETAAKGVAIGVFDGANKPFAINTGQLESKTDTTIGLQMVQLSGQEAVPGNINAMATVQIERL